MTSQKYLLAITTALLFSAAGALAQSTGTTSGGTTTGTTTTGTTTTSTGGTTTGTTTGGTTTGTSTTGTTSMGGTSGGTATGTPSTDDSGKGNAAHGRATPHTPNPNSSATAQAVQTALQKFDAQRDQFMADRKALLDKLQAATTEADRKAIIDQLKADQQADKDQRAQLGKEIRDELKTLRQQRKQGGG